MGHTERYDDYLMRNIAGEKRQNIFANAIEYFTK
jgi:phosphoribosylformylglycinamidine synthase